MHRTKLLVFNVRRRPECQFGTGSQSANNSLEGGACGNSQSGFPQVPPFVKTFGSTAAGNIIGKTVLSCTQEK